MNDLSVWWSVVLTAIGVLGFWLAASHVWWAWYLNLFNQVIWLTYSVLTQQWGFLGGVLVYTVVFTRNSIKATREHRAERAAA